MYCNSLVPRRHKVAGNNLDEPMYGCNEHTSAGGLGARLAASNGLGARLGVWEQDPR